jgi:hypothetical protein
MNHSLFCMTHGGVSLERALRRARFHPTIAAHKKSSFALRACQLTHLPAGP